MPLAFAKSGDVLTVIRIGGSPKVRSHLENLGITLGAPHYGCPEHPLRNHCEHPRFPCRHQYGDGQ